MSFVRSIVARSTAWAFQPLEDYMTLNPIAGPGEHEGDGMGVTIASPGGNPILAEQTARASSQAWLWERTTAFFDNPAYYTEPKRLTGGRTKHKGKKFNWAPGYIPYHRASVHDRDSGGKSGIRILSTRPFHPKLNLRGRAELTNKVAGWITMKLYSERVITAMESGDNRFFGAWGTAANNARYFYRHGHERYGG